MSERSAPTLDSTLILLLMDRELSKRKWISRAKKVYNACGKFYVPVAGIKANVRYNKAVSQLRISLIVLNTQRCLRIVLLLIEAE